MRIAEEVTFGGSGLDRAAELRGNDDVLRFARGAGSSRCIVLWKGNPLLESGSDAPVLARLPMDHPLLAVGDEEPVLLGRDETGLLFAQDISGWEPEGTPFLESGPGRSRSQPLPNHPEQDEAHLFVELRAVMADLTTRDAELAATAKALYNWHSTHKFCARCGQPSQIVMAGWQRSCDVCGGQHFPRTDPVVIMLIVHNNNVLLGRSRGWPQGMWSLLAGFVEPGETLEAAVRREVMEETQVPVGRVEYLSSQPWAFPNSLMFGCYGEATGDAITVDPAELEDAIWVPREEMADVFAGQHPVIRSPRRGAIAEFLLRNWLADRLD
ncbi:NUDIX hydrolase [Oceanicola sp. 22II-s10i]|uniref:NAD(+) diphosphatase n=1 Tax=Oceanicola sp. 22II-s10i TaxID=1317116 RepID=UPI000B527F40|nr:NAD(+) diphosphatase [Oceanicola sp. 22II-s10i]OWU86625.1 NUDIX hydrolase [Oceanicola sp. 22II-s10i]